MTDLPLAPRSASRWCSPWLWLTALVITGLLWLLASGMGRDPRELPSMLVGKPFPAFQLPGMKPPGQIRTEQALTGAARVVNVWASWCVACKAEHPLLMALSAELSARGMTDRLWGVNYKDTPEAATTWLQRGGDPYADSVVDAQGRLGIELGIYGVPETFVTDASGKVLFRHAGPLTSDLIRDRILPLLTATP